MLKAIIFDRDATLNRTTRILRAGQQASEPTDGYVLTPDELDLFETTLPALMLLRKNGILPFVFTQQNCVTKGLLDVAALDAIHAHMNGLLGPDAAIEHFAVAHSPTDPCAKPSPAMIFDIMERYNFEPHEVLVAGDSFRDHDAARAAGVAFAWVRDDLGRVDAEDMAATGCPVYDHALALAQDVVAAMR